MGKSCIVCNRMENELTSYCIPGCSACKYDISAHYANGCSIPDCDCVRTFGATTLPEDNRAKQYKD